MWSYMQLLVSIRRPSSLHVMREGARPHQERENDEPVYRFKITATAPGGECGCSSSVAQPNAREKTTLVSRPHHRVNGICALVFSGLNAGLPTPKTSQIIAASTSAEGSPKYVCRTDSQHAGRQEKKATTAQHTRCEIAEITPKGPNTLWTSSESTSTMRSSKRRSFLASLGCQVKRGNNPATLIIDPDAAWGSC